MDKNTLKWLLLAMIVVCGMLGYKVAMKGSSKKIEMEEGYEKPPPKYGVVTAILYCDDEPLMLMEDQVLHEGDTIHEVKIVKINSDKVEFEKHGKRWKQGVQEVAKPEWWKRKGKADST